MAKPHEETWTWIAHYQHIETPEGGDIGIYVDDRVLDASEKARLALAAQAPAMARLLLSAYADVEADANLECLGCGWTRLDSPAHAPDCELVAVLRAAGVMT